MSGVAASTENGPIRPSAQVERVEKSVAGQTPGTAGVVTSASSFNLLCIKHGKPASGTAGLPVAGSDSVGLVSVLVLHHQGPGTKVLVVAGETENLTDSRIRGRRVVQRSVTFKTRETFLRQGSGGKRKLI